MKIIRTGCERPVTHLIEERNEIFKEDNKITRFLIDQVVAETRTDPVREDKARSEKEEKR